jgi:AcrR family transcriptional regulator
VTTDTAGVDTRERVLRAASELFSARGFAGTSISSIREVSGVLPSSIYWEFGSKEGLLAAVLEDAAERWLQQAGDSIQRAMDRPAASADERLGDALDHLADAMAERPEFHRLLLLLALERRDAGEATLQIVRNVRQLALQGLARLYVDTGIVSEGTPEEAVADLTRASLAFFDGALVAAQIDPAKADLRRMFALLRAGVIAAMPQMKGAGGDLR